jgi:DMSO/TMAO reductase YedYZ molybdopterin-dependent catalytic subunit
MSEENKLPPAAPEADPNAGPSVEKLAREQEIARHNDEVRARMRAQTRRSFLTAGGAAVAGFAGWRWLMSRRLEDGIPWPLRRMQEINEGLWRDYSSSEHLAPDFTNQAKLEDRVNSDIGLEEELDANLWNLQVSGLDDRDEPLVLTLDDIHKLPRTQMTTEFKCVEGWSAVMQWAGVRFSDFMNVYHPAQSPGSGYPGDLPAYASLVTPDQSYYVGMEMQALLHPQTLLAYEVNGQPLTPKHGAPLRLVTPVKYGLKQIKRIGSIRYQISRPADYWAERGYDWYVGL